jgi:CheY-like chemotaxis protein
MKQKTVVAIYEDDPIDQFVYEQLLLAAGDTIEFKVFRNLTDAFKSPNFDFDIALINLHFGWCRGGLKILQTLKENKGENFLAIAVTSMLQGNDLQEIMKAGFTICLEKHIIFEKLGGKHLDFLRTQHHS